ncbi:aminopeptidase N [Sphingomonas sp.]|uniref:aminopeptidase N n=1 Tax=Sphingomonas sp. TaxID=28214 RepID=UPI00286C02C7|nr:aminopeptidase N [Sphingomonas sp.]
MMDARLNPEAPASPDHVTILRKDYQPPDYWVREVVLDVSLDPEATRARAVLSIERNGTHDRPLRLAGDGLEPVAVRANGGDARWSIDGKMLVIELSGATAQVETEVVINPAANSKLMGLYASGGILCTQCESEGFRRIPYHPDRPDILSTYRVTMRADKAHFPVLLANGNLVASGDGPDGSHWAEWEDPFPKPSYLFAMVAGDLAANRSTFMTSGGRTVDLAIWVREKDLPKTAHAMTSLKQAMAWDEATYGREYDLDLFNIVAVDDFNFGAMENKGLNVFNSRFVLADQDTATDADFDAIAGVVAHEYFHNWSGNRVTCRDWFQLSLKEGFTVFRDQSFSADIGSAAVKRIDDVRLLRAVQFPEDSGPLAHPVRPDSYLEITNFYTATIYNKGAEVIRMMRTILGAEAFRAGADLYFARHDGEAATCDDFVAAMADASGVDLTRFKIWYEQAGTPKVEARLVHDAAARTATLHLAQSVAPTPGQPDKKVMPIPLRTALIGADSGSEIGAERVIMLEEATQAVLFDGVDEAPLLSINRGFSAPVNVAVERQPGELAKLAASDGDPFARYEALQEMMFGVLIAGASGEPVDQAPVIAAMRGTLLSDALDPAFKGEALVMPSEALIGDRMDSVDPDAIHMSREALRAAVGAALADALAPAQAAGAAGSDLSSAAKGVRRLKGVALALIAAGDPLRGAALAKAQYDGADNMTDRQGALAVLTMLDGPERTAALADFYDRYRGDGLVIDKWFALQAGAPRSDTIDTVEALLGHGDFTMKNPNRLRALAGSFAGNQWVFHAGSGRGYRLLGELIIRADGINPQVAARLVPPLGRWRRFEPGRAALMRAELERIVATPGLSKDVFEQASKSLV